MASLATAPAKLTKKQAELLMTPRGFAKGVLGHDVWGMQGDIMDSVAANRRTVVKSCNASGKTFTSADITLWWLTKYYKKSIVVTTAPTWNQVEKLLWGEIRHNCNNSKIAFPKPNATELKIDEKSYAVGISTNDSDRFQGFHAEYILLIFDEAPGVRPDIWSGAQGLRAGGRVHWLAIGNPVEPAGDFHTAFHGSRHMWNKFTISAFDTPNLARCYIEYDKRDEVTGKDVRIRLGKSNASWNLIDMSDDDLDKSTRPYLVSRRWVLEMFQEWGPEHPYFVSRVLGDFPTETDDMLCPLSWLEKLKNKFINEPPAGFAYDDGAKQARAPGKGKVKAGLDVAGPGEAETVLTLEEDGVVFKTIAWPQADPRGQIKMVLDPIFQAGRLESVNVDSVGIGWGIYLYLADLYGKQDEFGHGIVRPVNVGLAASDPKKFANAKAEYFWQLRLAAQGGELLGVLDEKTIGQLATIKYEHNSKGQIAIESKQDLLKRGVKSPDRAESLMLCKARLKKINMPPIISVTKSGDDGGGLSGGGGGWSMGRSTLGESWGGGNRDY